MKRIALAVALLVSVASPAWAGIDEARSAFQRGDFKGAFREIMPLAEQGDAQAQARVGFLYENGLGVPRDADRATAWYRRAARQWMPLAEQGDAKAQYGLGDLYRHGRGLPQDKAEAIKWYRMAAENGHAQASYVLGIDYQLGGGVAKDIGEAVRWYRRAAEQGHVDAPNSLGALYDLGVGVAQDYAEAAKWYRMAADRGNADAQNSLGVMYQFGQGVPQDHRKAVKWFQRGAAQGHSLSLFGLGVMYELGRGVPQDYIQAHTLYNLAAAQGAVLAPENRDILARKMTPTQVAEAQRLARLLGKKFAREAAIRSRKSGGPSAASTATRPNGRGLRLTSSGSGFVVSWQGHILTNNHVIEDCDTLRTRWEGVEEALTLVARDTRNDLALLKKSEAPKAVATFRAGRATRPGDRVLVIGYPLHGLLASEANVTIGTVSASAGLRDDTRYLQVTAPVQPGNSGGPLLDQSGNVVGVVVAKLNAMRLAKLTGDIPQNVNFAIKAALARAFLDAHVVDYETSPSTKRLEGSEIAARGRKFTAIVECWTR